MSLINPHHLSTLGDGLPIKTLGYPGSNFNPATLTSPLFAVTAHEVVAQPLFQEPARTTPATANDNPVGGGLSLTGFGTQSFSQATAANKPLLKTGVNGINGHNALFFNGTSHFLDLTGLTASSGAKTFYLVVNNATIAGTEFLYFDTQTGRLALYQLIPTIAGRIGYFDGSVRNVAAATTGNQILTFAFGGGTGTIYRNGASIGSAAYVDKAVGGTTQIGKSISIAAYFSGLLGALYIYNALHSLSEISAMNNYLLMQWGI